MNPLLTFIENQSKLGATRDVITNQLLGQGWKRLDIDQAFISLEVPATPVISATPITASSAPPAFTPPIAPSSQPSQPMSAYTPPIQQNTILNQSAPVQKKSHTGLIIAIIIILLLIGGGIYAWMTFFNTPSQTAVIPPIAPVATSTPAIATTTTSIATTTTVVKTTQTPVVVTPTPLVQLKTVPTNPVASKPVATKVPGTWQNDSRRYLCQNGFADQCSSGDLIDLNSNRSVLLGAVEYCQYLDPDAMTIDKTIQNFWRLPSISELIAKAASDPTSFHYDRYWSISLDTKGSATTHDQLKKSLDSTGASSFTSDYSSDHNGGYVRCIQ